LVMDGVVVSRSLKPIPNLHVQELFGHLEGYDGELIVGNPTDKDVFRNTTSGVMSRDGEPDVYFYVFDKWDELGYWEERFYQVSLADKVYRVKHKLVYSADEINIIEEKALAEGFEGVMLRSPSGMYKNGRSTTREGWLMKLKRFEDSEALVIGMEERMHNNNIATTNILGHSERTSHQENLLPTNTMGALICVDVKTGVQFNLGTGFDDATRKEWWDLRTKYARDIGVQNNSGMIVVFQVPELIVKYRYFPTGSKDKPRFPSYLSIRKD